MRHILLDSSPLGVISKPGSNPEVIAITDWAMRCLASGHIIYVPEVIDYEVRRELLRAGKTAGVQKLDGLKSLFYYLPISTKAMLLAADLWAQARRTGFATSAPDKLDVDVILAAQALTLNAPLTEITVATSNVGHLSRFVPSDLWPNIQP